MAEKRKFRCTRTRMYDTPGCPGHTSASSRQGHYIFTETPMGAVAELIQSWPDEVVYGFTIHDWEEDAMWTWDLSRGILKVVDEGSHLPKCFDVADAFIRDPQVAGLVENLRTLGVELDKRAKEKKQDAEIEERRIASGSPKVTADVDSAYQDALIEIEDLGRVIMCLHEDGLDLEVFDVDGGYANGIFVEYDKLGKKEAS